MLAIRCYTCGKVIGHMWERYLELLRNGTPKEALDKLGLKRYCCRRMLLTHVDTEGGSKPEYNESEIEDPKGIWKIIENYFKTVGLVRNQIDSFNEFINHGLQEIFDGVGEVVVSITKYKKYMVRFGQVYVDFPYTLDLDRAVKPITPNDARISKLHYDAPVSVDITTELITEIPENQPEVETTVYKKQIIFRLPIMIGSCRCNLVGKTREEKKNAGECYRDEGGYFIIGGVERVLITQERFNYNYLHVTKKISTKPQKAPKTTKQQKQKPGSKHECVAEFRSMSDETNHSVLLMAAVSHEGRTVKFSLPYIKDEIPVGIVFKALGYSDDDIRKMINPTCPEMERIVNFIIRDSFFTNSVDENEDTTDSEEELLSDDEESVPQEEDGEDDGEEREDGEDGEENREDRDDGDREDDGEEGEDAGILERSDVKKMMDGLDPNDAHKIATGLIAAISIIDENRPSNRSTRSKRKKQVYSIEQEKALKFIGNAKKIHAVSVDKQVEYAHQILEHELFPHLGITSTPLQRALHLGDIVHKLLVTYLYPDKRPADEKSNISNKRFEGVGELLRGLVEALFKRFIRSIEQHLPKRPDFQLMLARFNIFSRLINCFATGNWGTPKSYTRSGVSQVVNRLSYAGFLSHLRRLVIPTGKEGKNTKIRQLHATQQFFVCPAETPEGRQSGLVRNLALMAKISQRVSKHVVMESIERESRDPETNLIKINEIDINLHRDLTKIFINGSWLGVVNDPGGFMRRMKSQRKNKIIDPSVSISYDECDDEIKIFSDEGRIMRPLFTLNEEGLLKLTEEDGINWCDLVDKGLIVYLDANEIATSVIAMFPEDLEKEDYDYCEIHPSMMLGICASNILWPDHSQSPRNCYGSSMGKQAMGEYVTSLEYRTDTVAHYMKGQRPLVSTRPSRYMGFSDMPSGENVIVAIACYGGWNQEDSIILNQSAIDRGLFRNMTYRTVTVEEQKRGSRATETITIPDKDTQVKSYNYNKLGEDGIIEPGMMVEERDVLVGKVLIKTFKDGTEEMRDQSVIAKNNETGIIDKVFISENSDGYKIVRIKIRSLRIPEMGDKFASRAAQKGTVGITLPAEDLPFNPATGMVPDLIMNPHAIPSRMTINQLMETILGKACALDGKFGDATPFTSESTGIVNKLMDNLQKLGYEGNGYETLCNGMTGEMFTAKIFMGPTYYQRLKHLVSDKIHSRSYGHVQLLTRQPSEGRSRDGGLRFGEMERDCMISHGASELLRERLFLRSDPYQVTVCRNCGSIPNTNKECNECGSDVLVQTNTPYAMKLLQHELMAMGIKVRLMPKE